MMRVFYDRLTNDVDRTWFKENLSKAISSAFMIEKDYDEWFVQSNIMEIYKNRRDGGRK